MAISLPIFSGSFLLADQISVNQFKYLNSNDNSTIIDAKSAQDILNVDISPSGKSVKKRSGYGVYKTFNNSLGMHGGLHAFDGTGNDYQLWGSSTSLYGIVADGAPIQLISSATLNSTWDCADTQGNSYCVDSNRDAFIKTNGTTMTWFATPLGTMVESTPDRVVVAGVSASPNTLFVSQSNTFTNFVTAGLNTDAFTEVIASPGSKLTHIRWGCGKLLWWKDASFGWFDFDDQYSAQVKTISDVIGTFDNTSAIDPGGNVWFRGQDGHIWKYDCSGLAKETIDITPQVQASGRRTSNSWTQTSQVDWQSGTINETGTLSTTISVGDLTVSSFSKTDTVKADFQAGTGTNITYETGDIIISTNAVELPNNGFETGDFTNWTNSGWSGPTGTLTGTGGSCSIIPQAGSWQVYSSNAGATVTASILDASSGASLGSTTVSWVDNSCTWVLRTITVGSSLARRMVKLKFNDTTNTLTTDPFILNGADVKFYSASTCGGAVCIVKALAIDTVNNTPKSNITTANFTSQVFDTGISSPMVTGQAGWTTNEFIPYFELQHSVASGGPFLQVMTSSGTNKFTNRYIRYVSSFTVGTNDDALTTLNDATILARSTGTWYSVVKNAPNITAWSTFNGTYSNNNGANNFFIRSSTSPFYVTNSSPPWVVQSPGALVSASTGTYFQLIDSFTVTAATQIPTLSDFSINWFEGTATDQAYLLYFDNAIWASVSYGTGVSSNTYIFKNDLINNGWTLYDFGAGGMLVQNNHLFFGAVSTGTVYQFGSGTSDNGSAINSFWKSKDFTGSDPFLQNQLTQIDTFAKKNQNNSLTVTYSMDTSTTTTSYTIPLSSATANIIQSRKLLPSGKLGYTFNVKYGDNTNSSAWELFGFRVGYVQQGYRPSQ